MLGKPRASRPGIKQKLSPIHSLRSASTSLMTSDMSKCHSSVTLSAFQNCDAVFSCPSETSQDALCVATCPCALLALTAYQRLEVVILCLPPALGHKPVYRPASPTTHILALIVLTMGD